MLVSFCVNLVETSRHDGTPLSQECGDEEVVADSTIAILLQEGHQEAKTDIDHDMNILEHCEKKRERRLNISCDTCLFVYSTSSGWRGGEGCLPIGCNLKAPRTAEWERRESWVLFPSQATLPLFLVTVESRFLEP